MSRLHELDHAFSPRLVRNTRELAVHDRRYQMHAFPGSESGKVRLRFGAGVSHFVTTAVLSVGGP